MRKNQAKHYNIKRKYKQEQKSNKSDKKAMFQVKQRELEAKNGAPQGDSAKVGDIARREQERTRINKKLFLEFYEKSRFISGTCIKVQINRDTYYQWMRNDPEFKKAVLAKWDQQRDDIEDLLLGKIYIEKDGPSIRYWLDRRHPLYKPKSINELTPSDGKTFEDLMDIIFGKEDNKDNENNEQGNNREGVKDPGQTGTANAVQTKSGTELLLAEKDAQELNPQSPAKGNK